MGIPGSSITGSAVGNPNQGTWTILIILLVILIGVFFIVKKKSKKI
jgi:LPXTG-motif cell wall-anchored protein